jgi:TonB family protein
MKGFDSWVLGYLVNSLWEVPLVFIAALATTRTLRRTGAQMEHRVWVCALALQALLPACWVRSLEPLQELWNLLSWGAKKSTAGGETHIGISTGVAYAHGVLRLPQGVFVGIAVAYGCSLLYFAARLGWGLWKTGGMRRQAGNVLLTEAAAAMWERHCRVFGVEGAELVQSSMVSGPVTIGVSRRVLLVPPGFLDQIDEEDMDAVMAHECAHMRRRDYLKNLLYNLMSLPVAYHPALWLTYSQMAETREMVCDATAAEAAAGRERYARSLLRLASMLVNQTPSGTLHAIGIFDANTFERRVMKLTRGQVEVAGMRRILMVAACLVVGVATCASALALRMEVRSGTAAQPANHANKSDGTDEITHPVLVYQKQPVYPAQAKADKNMLNGSCVIGLTVDEEGMPIDPHIVKSLRADYDQSALEAVREWRFKPAQKNGQPVAVELKTEIHFEAY